MWFLPVLLLSIFAAVIAIYSRIQERKENAAHARGELSADDFEIIE